MREERSLSCPVRRLLNVSACLSRSQHRARNRSVLSVSLITEVGSLGSLGTTAQITPGIRWREAEVGLFCLVQLTDKAADVSRTCKCATLSSILSAAGTTNPLTDSNKGVEASE